MKFHFLRIKQHPIAAAVAAALALGGGLVASNGYAATATGSLAVSASITNACTVSTTSTLAFGSYVSGPGNVAKDNTGTVSTTCTTGVTTTVTLGQGANAAAGSTDSVPLRQMADGANRLAYDLYSDTVRTSVWGNTSGTGVVGTGTGLAVDLTVYGRIPAGQNKPAGINYADTVVVTVTF